MVFPTNFFRNLLRTAAFTMSDTFFLIHCSVKMAE